MKFIGFAMAWMLLTAIPSAALWGEWASTHGIRPLPFALSLVYGVTLFASVPYVLRWKFPRLFAE